ncbi:MAG: carboxymuconolactone decarboxylase family protein [Paracoccaceae bacterium]
MQLIEAVKKEEAEGVVKESLEAIESDLGFIPNGMAVAANSQTSLKLMFAIDKALEQGELNFTQREMIALAVSQANNCRYCLSAHSEFCSMATELDSTDIIRARLCEADDPKDQAMLDLAVAIVERKGELPENQLETARKSGLSDSVIIEIISNVISAMYGNYINHVAKTDIDWPLCRMDL